MKKSRLYKIYVLFSAGPVLLKLKVLSERFFFFVLHCNMKIELFTQLRWNTYKVYTDGERDSWTAHAVKNSNFTFK